MTNREIYALEMDLLKKISGKKFTWRKIKALFELSAIAEKH